MDNNPWKGRLGIEVMGKMAGCCVETIAKWRPSMIGLKRECTYCNSFMKTIRATEVLAPVYTGGMLEHHKEVKEPDLALGGLYFASSRFPDSESVERWMGERDLEGHVSKVDEHASFVALGDALFGDSVRLVWVAPGVVGEIGVSEKQVATGGGQASMSSPGITTTSMASGGTAHPHQGPAEAAAEVVGVPPIIQGVTDVQDGHQHEYHLTPHPEVGGFRVKAFTSFNDGHAHMIECGVESDGTIDTRTAPDQAPVGGHAHSHRIAHPENKSFGTDGRPYEKQYRVTGSDLTLLNKAAGNIGDFCRNINGSRSLLDKFGITATTRDIIERANMEDLEETVVPIRAETIERLRDCARELTEIRGEIASAIATEKGWGKETVVDPKEKGKYSGRDAASLRAEYDDLKESGPHKEGSAKEKKMKELAFAIRAKTGWGKVD
jgi:hypothetical protein